VTVGGTANNADAALRHQAMQIADWCCVPVAARVELNDAPAALLARPDFGELFLGRSARTPQPAAPGRDPPQATIGPAVTAVGAHRASHDEG
jgi:hypothetical protein